MSAKNVNTPSSRNALILSMYTAGMTMQEIGNEFGISRARVDQILKKMGLQKGLRAQEKVAIEEKNQREKELRHIEIYGMPMEEFKKWRKQGAHLAYCNQRSSAKDRGIEWKMNFHQWLSIWLASGKLELRGKGIGKYVMSRKNDVGAYEPTNVFINLSTENSREGFSRWYGKVKDNPGVFCLFPGHQRPWVAKYGNKLIGRYSTCQMAVDARAAFLGGLTTR